MSIVGRKLAVGSSLKTLNLVVLVLVSFLITPFVVHSLGDRMYGIWSLIGTFIGYYGILELGLSSAVGRYVALALGAGDQERCTEVFNTSLALFSLLGIVVLLVSGLVAVIAPHFIKRPEDAAIFWKAILLLGASLAVGFPMRVFKGVLEAHLRFDRTAEMDLLTLVLRTILVIGSLLIGYKVVALAWATFLAAIPATFLYPYFLFRDLPFLRLSSRHMLRGTAKELFSYSSYTFIVHLGGILREGIGPFVVAPFLGFAGVAHYKIASMLAEYYAMFTLTVIGVFQPMFSRLEGAGDREAIKRTLFFSTKIAVCVTGFLAFGLIAYGKVFIRRWIGPSYADSYPCMVPLVLGYACVMSQRPSVYLLYAKFRHKFLALLTSVEGAANLTLGLIFVRHHGLTGVAMGMFITVAVSKLLIQPAYVCSVSGIHYKEYIWTFLRAGSVVLLALIAPVAIAMRFAVPHYKAIFLLSVLSFILYAVPVVLYVFDRGELQQLLRVFWPGLTLRKGEAE